MAASAVGGLRFHDLRHSYITWLMTDGVPVNVVRRAVGHEKASTTLDRYTHTPDDYADRVRLMFADFPPVARPGPPGRGTFTWPGTEPGKGRPPSGGDGGRRRFGSGGVEPNPLSGHGGCDRRGSASCTSRENSPCKQVCLSGPVYVEWCNLHSLRNRVRRV
ncbi:tyrosine-type recombinase/integrase [Micromonospora sp. LOL_024]|uniref:tyrosine-type recombinase/integrase n=1 Tax=Micromonospora sp. LOL_024 TaxID=3345412 RepID=UPI003A872EDE